MRIALITPRNPVANDADLDGQPAGLARVLAAQGHRVTMYARDDGTAPGRTAILGRGVSVEHVQAGPARRLAEEECAKHMPDLAMHLAKRWQVKRPDIVHSFGWASGMAALGAVRGTDIPVVQTFGSLACAEPRDGESVSASRLRLETLIGRKAAAVLAASSAEAAELAKLAVPRAVVKVVPCGVDTEVFSPAGTQAAKGGKVRLVAMASSTGAPGLRTVLRAVAQLPEAELVLVGGPDGRHLPKSGPFRELARLATELRIRNRLTFAGRLEAADLAAVLRSADVLVSTSPYEPAGIGAIQAMACGTPVIVSAVGGHRDAVIDGTTGLLITPEHAAMLVHRLRWLLAAPALLNAYGIAAADRAQSRYSWERIGRETAAAYASCLPGRTAEIEAEAEAEDLDPVAVG